MWEGYKNTAYLSYLCLALKSNNVEISTAFRFGIQDRDRQTDGGGGVSEQCFTSPPTQYCIG